jgi:hypothetical protein
MLDHYYLRSGHMWPCADEKTLPGVGIGVDSSLLLFSDVYPSYLLLETRVTTKKSDSEQRRQMQNGGRDAKVLI